MQKLIKLFSMLTMVINLIIHATACTFHSSSGLFANFPPWPQQKSINDYQNDITNVKNYLEQTLIPQRNWVKKNQDDPSSAALLNYYDSLINSDNAQMQDDNYQILVLQAPGGFFTPEQKLKAYKILLDEITDLTLSLNEAKKVPDFLQSDKNKINHQILLAIKESNQIKPKTKGVNLVGFY